VALRRIDAFDEWTAHPSDDADWRELAPQIPAPPPPALLLTGWRDAALAPQLADYAALRRALDGEGAPAPELIVGPWTRHDALSTRRARGLLVRSVLDFLDRKLRQLPGDAAPVRVFVHGSDRWLELPEWPPPEAVPLVLYLRSEGQANGLVGDGGLSREAPPPREPTDRFVCDPEDPVPSTDLRGVSRSGPEDLRPVEARSDVLCYTSAPLEEELDVVGGVELVLFAESSAPDSDFTAKLVDVAPDGRAVGCCEGIVRARWRGDGAGPTWLTAGTPRRFDVDLTATARRFPAGHSIRLEVSSANFPRFDRNSNTRSEPEAAPPEDFAPARQTVHHDREHASRLVLRVRPRIPTTSVRNDEGPPANSPTGPETDR
jgi:putative CocE/NonD family hydrolase